MSGISSGIGLISGIDTASLIDQLMAIEARPVTDLQERVQEIDFRRTTFLGLSAKILALKDAALRFNELSFFRNFNAPSSNESILTATAGESAVPSSHAFRVRALTTNHSVVSRGFADADTTPVGVGTLSIEVGNGRVNRSTELSTLNGGQGVRRGIITITDRAGATADIDLTSAVTIYDVLDAINTNTTVNVRARVTGVSSDGAGGDRLVIEDLTPAPAVGAPPLGNLIIVDKLGGASAADLGIAGSFASSRVDGKDLVSLSTSTPLSLFNDGNGVDVGRLIPSDLVFTKDKGGPNEESFTVPLSGALGLDTDLRALNSGRSVRLGVIRITDRAGKSVEVDLSDLDITSGVSLRDVVDRIKADVDAAGVAVAITPINAYLQIRDTTGLDGDGAGNLIIEDVTGFAATDLGIAGDAEDDHITGRDIHRIATIGDVINAINYAKDNNGRLVEAGISDDGNGITLKAVAFGTTIEVNAGENSTAAQELGIDGATFSLNDPFESRHLIAGLNTVLLHSLNGGSGINLGQVQFTDASNNTVTIDFSDPQSRPHTLGDVIDLINANPDISLTASVNASGNGIEIRDDSGGAGSVAIRDLAGGSMAAELGIAAALDGADGNVVNGGNLQLQYISRQTLLSELNGGRGIALTDFRITDSSGAIHTVRLAKNTETVGQVIDAINFGAAGKIEARINDTGDGIVVIDTASGSSSLTIEDIDGGQAAANLRLAGTADDGDDFIDGTFEIHIEIGPSDTLNDISRKLNDAGAQVAASVLNDGGSVNPYSLTITSNESGRRGELTIDMGAVDLGFVTISKAQDALISIGDGSSGNGLLISSPSNTVDNVIEGVTLDLLAASDEEVTVTVSQDLDSIITQMNRFVEKYNDVQAAIDEATSFDTDTLERGPLLGDSTVNLIRTRLHRVMSRRFEGTDPSVSRLVAIGLRLVADNRIEFDEEKFRETYERSPDLVEQLFTTEDTGLGAVMKETLDELTRDFDGVIARKNDLLSDQQELLNDRIDRLNVLLAAKRARLETQFAGLESSLATIQAQQNSLTNLAQLASSMSLS